MDNLKDLPNADGFFGDYGGKFVPETLMFALKELEETYEQLKSEPDFLKQIDQDLCDFVGRPSPLYFADRLTKHYDGPNIWLKREDLNHTGAHKINNTVGQILLAKAMGKKTYYCRNWGWSTWRSHCNSSSKAGFRMPYLYGCCRCSKAVLKRLSYKAARCRSACG
jgi:hypothetical protein